MQTSSMAQTNDVILIQVDVLRPHRRNFDQSHEFNAIKDKIEGGKNFDGSTVYIGRDGEYFWFVHLAPTHRPCTFRTLYKQMLF